jgi:ATP/maltotriose-dependent transcriptional regulator MalT
MAITRREQQMLDLEEQGLRPFEIADRLRISEARVVWVLGNLNGGLQEERRDNARTARACASLRDKVLAAGGHR